MNGIKDRKRVVKSFTMIGNECEIIESFVRYNSCFLNEMYFIYDMGCVDTTIEILKKLRTEGYPIVLCDESLTLYEQRAMENKYLYMLAEDVHTDIIIPLDADEFLIADGNPRVQLERLELHKVYEINWKNYVASPADNKNELFVPKRLTHYRDEKETSPKVIIPAQMVRSSRVMVDTGHHHVMAREKIEVEKINNLKIAHYPLISEEQYKSKILCNNIRFIIWRNRGDGEGKHLNRLLAEMEDGISHFYDAHRAYSISREGDKISEGAIDCSFCDADRLLIRYGELAKVNVEKNLVRTGQIMALRAYNLEIEKQENKESPKILVYGTGGRANTLLCGMPDNLVNIVAYIDSDQEKQFTMFHKRIVVTPEYVRCFLYDKIVISSDRYYEEMRENLLRVGIAEEKIAGKEYLMGLLIDRVSYR